MKRREFLSSAAIVGASLPLVTTLGVSCSRQGGGRRSPQVSAAELGMYSFAERAPDGKPLRAALIGCGSRGTGAAFNFLDAGNDLSIVALADVLEDRLLECREKLATEKNNVVADDMCFIGFDAYEKAIAQDVDMVLICSPTHFHPDQLRAAINANKHVFMEKPAAVDPVGIRSVLVSARHADRSGLCVVTGNQRRHARDYWEAYLQIKNGAIGDVLSATAHWNQGAWWNRLKRPNESDMEYHIRNWFNIKWLSGDHLLDQGIHNIDIATWFTGYLPERATGYGGRAQRLTGDIFDFFAVDYRYPNNRRMLATARQIDGCDNDVSESVMGTEGVCYLWNNNIHIVNYQGEEVWKYDYDAMPVNNPYVQEHIHLVEAIRQNKKINQLEDLANSTMVAIMGREAAYTGKPITWDEIMASDLRYGPDTYDINASLPFYEEGVAPRPGQAPMPPRS